VKYSELSDVVRRLSRAVDSVAWKWRKEDPESRFPMPILQEEAAVGAAAFLCYFRDLITVSNKETFRREDILVILEMLSSDDELFPMGIGRLMWEAYPDEDTDDSGSDG
jgi:hypothetical protein